MLISYVIGFNLQATTHEMLASIHRILLPSPVTTKSWSVQMMALDRRSHLESTESMRRERSFLQLEQLVFHTVPTLYTPENVKLPSASDLLARSSGGGAAAAVIDPAHALLIATRLNDAYTSGLAPFYHLKRALADSYVTIDAHQSALVMYEELGLWDRVIEAYLRLGRQSKV